MFPPLVCFVIFVLDQGSFSTYLTIIAKLLTFLHFFILMGLKLTIAHVCASCETRDDQRFLEFFFSSLHIVFEFFKCKFPLVVGAPSSFSL
jgi:hypothetical protein